MHKGTGRFMRTRYGATGVLVMLLATASAALMSCDPSDVKAVWHMDETSGSVMQDAVADHDGAITSDVTVGQPGKTGTAYSFSGSGKVTVPSSDDLDAGSQPLFVSIWLKSTKTPSHGDWDLIRRGTATTSGGNWKMEYYPDGTTSCGFKGDDDSTSIHDGPAVNDNSWHQVQCIKTSSSIKLVVDGTIYSKSASIGSISNDQPVIVGSHGGSEFYQGLLDEATIIIG